MVPLYGISSLIAIFSLEAAFVIDAIRDIYEVSLPTKLEWYGTYGPSGICNLLFLPTAAGLSRR